MNLLDLIGRRVERHIPSVMGAVSTGTIIAVFPDGRVTIKPTNTMFESSLVTTKLSDGEGDGWLLGEVGDD